MKTTDTKPSLDDLCEAALIDCRDDLIVSWRPTSTPSWTGFEIVDTDDDSTIAEGYVTREGGIFIL